MEKMPTRHRNGNEVNEEHAGDDTELPDVDDDDEFEAFVMRHTAAEIVAVCARHAELLETIAWLERQVKSNTPKAAKAAPTARALHTARKFERAFARKWELTSTHSAAPGRGWRCGASALLPSLAGCREVLARRPWARRWLCCFFGKARRRCCCCAWLGEVCSDLSMQ